MNLTSLPTISGRSRVTLSFEFSQSKVIRLEAPNHMVPTVDVLGFINRTAHHRVEEVEITKIDEPYSIWRVVLEKGRRMTSVVSSDNGHELDGGKLGTINNVKQKLT